jgi:Holliday junction DNA helicase RuvA
VIGWLQGRLIGQAIDGQVLVAVHGVGYRVSVPAPLAGAMVTGAEVELFVHTHVRDDDIVLYGFATVEDRRCFEVLIGAHGVGPSLALAMLSAIGPAALARAVVSDDIDALCTVPGVGRKTAARLVLELKSKFGAGNLVATGGGSDDRGDGARVRSEVRAALAELGYEPDEIRRALHGAGDEGPAEELLRRALRELAGAR